MTNDTNQLPIHMLLILKHIYKSGKESIHSFMLTVSLTMEKVNIERSK